MSDTPRKPSLNKLSLKREAAVEQPRLEERLHTVLSRRSERESARLSSLAGRLDALSPLKVLARGFAAAEATDGRILSSAKTLSKDQEIRVRFADGAVLARILGEGVAQGVQGKRGSGHAGCRWESRMSVHFIRKAPWTPKPSENS